MLVVGYMEKDKFWEKSVSRLPYLKKNQIVRCKKLSVEVASPFKVTSSTLREP